jgi:hypothetical protein
MNAMSEPDPRPVAVTVVAVLAFVLGALQVINGIQLILVGEAGAWWQAGFDFFAGALAIFVGLAMLKGDPLGRIVATVVFALNIVAWITGNFLIEIGTAWVGGLIGAVIALVAIVLLWIPKSNEWFRSY